MPHLRKNQESQDSDLAIGLTAWRGRAPERVVNNRCNLNTEIPFCSIIVGLDD